MAETLVATQEQVDKMLEELRVKNEQIDTLIKLAGNVGTPEAPKTNGRGGKKEGVPTLDTKTGISYRTKSAAGMAVARELGIPVNTYVYYTLINGSKEKPAPCPNRFKTITLEEHEANVAAREKATAGKK